VIRESGLTIIELELELEAIYTENEYKMTVFVCICLRRLLRHLLRLTSFWCQVHCRTAPSIYTGIVVIILDECGVR